MIVVTGENPLDKIFVTYPSRPTLCRNFPLQASLKMDFATADGCISPAVSDRIRVSSG